MTPKDVVDRTSHRPARRGDIVVHTLDGEAVLYDERSGAVHRFNETALAVWNACDGWQEVSEISGDIAERYELGSGEARTEVEKVIRELHAKGLLIERSKAADKHEPRLPSRREMLCGGSAKLIYTAPLISTFLATGACASGPSASAAIGGGGCKTVGYSCAVLADCCVSPSNGLCTAGDCCGFTGQACDDDADCCAARTCSASLCVD